MALTQVSSGLISSVANTAITGNIISSQITSVTNTQVTGLGTMSTQNCNNVTISGGNVCVTYVCSTYVCGLTCANTPISCASTCTISPIVCGTTCLISPYVAGTTHCASGGNFSTNCCVASACVYTNAICQCGAGNINSNCCILGQIICGISCVQGTCVCAAGGNLATNCCVVAPIVCSTSNISTPCCVTAAIVCGTTCLISGINCATTCFVGNGSGLTNLPVAASTVSCICSITATNASSIAFTGLSSSYRYYYLQFDQAFTCDCSGLITAFSNNNGSSYISVTCYFQSSAVCSASSTCNGVIYNNHPSSACVSGIMCIFNAGKPYHLQTMSTVNFGYSNATQLASYASILVGAYCCINAFCMFDCCGTTFSGVFTLYGVS